MDNEVANSDATSVRRRYHSLELTNSLRSEIRARKTPLMTARGAALWR